MNGRFLESHWFVWVTQMNHLPMDIDHEKHHDWLTMQVPALFPNTPHSHLQVLLTCCLTCTLCLSLRFSYKPPATLRSPSSTTGSADTSTFKSSTSESVLSLRTRE